MIFRARYVSESDTRYFELEEVVPQAMAKAIMRCDFSTLGSSMHRAALAARHHLAVGCTLADDLARPPSSLTTAAPVRRCAHNRRGMIDDAMAMRSTASQINISAMAESSLPSPRATNAELEENVRAAPAVPSKPDSA